MNDDGSTTDLLSLTPDELQAELTRRYRDGEADVDTLLKQQPGA